MTLRDPYAAGTDAREEVFAEPRRITDVGACDFYHTMDLPGVGLIEGEWDLRGREAQYLGGVDLAGKRVLEVGPASGHLTRFMESRGADVVSCDLSYEHEWDVVPFARADIAGYTRERQAHIHRLNNGFWFTHTACGLRSKVVYSPVYDLPSAVGPVDVCTFGCVLLHLRDPFLALQRALRLTRSTVIVTEAIHRNFIPTMLTQRFGRPSLVFLPRHKVRRPMDGWWIVTPRAVLAFLGTLGFE
ncbi:MAG: hypothetical protein H3C62_05155, partial [Gemmatimonadaceae bacterium]|nr:hypothetical protein [Gemmatimonadaceae bacterium]